MVDSVWFAKTIAWFVKTIGLAAWSLCIGLSATALSAGEGKRMDEDQLRQQLEECYQRVKSVDPGNDKLLAIYVEQLSYLVVAAGSHASGSPGLDAVFSRIQKESPTLMVPRFVTTPAELKKFLDDLARDDANERVYSAYRRKVRTISELIAQAKQAITARSGFVFDPSVPVIRSQ